jgi:Ion channel
MRGPVNLPSATARMAEILLGSAISLGNIAIHAFVMTAVVKSARWLARRSRKHPTSGLMALMMTTVAVLMLAHFTEVAAWALIYSALDVTPPGTDNLYFAFVNYTTLGYGDIIPAQGWRLLGPMTAMNGVLLFGWSTAVIFEVLTHALRVPAPRHISAK